MGTETLHFLTISICIFTLILATAALMPQLKRALVLLRDAILGATLVVALSFAGFLVWSRVFDGKPFDVGSAGTANQSKFDLFKSAEDDRLDPSLYQQRTRNRR